MSPGYRITVTAAACRQLAEIPRNDQRRIQQKIDHLEVNPRPPGVTGLEGKNNLFRIRVGDYRIVYKIEDDRLVVIVIRIGHRREVYRRL